MKARVLSVLRCPECAGPLDLGAFEQAGQSERSTRVGASARSRGDGRPRDEGSTTDEIEEGLLTCRGCGRPFPIINGIPRLLPDALIHLAVRYHEEFFRRRRIATAPFIGRFGQAASTRWWKAEGRTVASYSYQWRKFKQMFPAWEQIFLDSITPITPDFFAGKLGLDAGCGFGRSLKYSASYGAEMIGLDLSEAIEAAREKTRHLPNVHLVQGDIFHPPVAAASLDFAYSIGVLHHLPDPKRGFLTLTRLLEPGAPIFIWVYLRKRGRQIAAFTAMRALSTRMPLRLLNLVCLALAAGQWLAFVLPYRTLRRLPATRGLAERIPFTLYARYPFRVLHTDWFDGLSAPLVNYYRREDIAEWYRAAGHERVRIDEDWNGRAIGYAPAAAPVEPVHVASGA